MSYLTTILSDSPEHLWKLDELSGTVASDSISTDNGTFSTGVTPGTLDGWVSSNSFTFAGTGGITVPTHGDISSTDNSSSFELWFKLTSYPSSAHYNLLTNGSDTGTAYSGIGALIDQNTHHIVAYITGGAGVDSGYVPPLNQWTYLVVVDKRSTDTLEIYIDGQKVKTYYYGANAPIAPKNSLSIGYYDYSGGSLYFAGEMQYVAWYNYTLTDSQVLNHFVAAPAGSGTITDYQVVLNSLATGSATVTEYQNELSSLVQFQATDPKLYQVALNSLVQYQATDPKLYQVALNVLVTYGVPVDPGPPPTTREASSISVHIVPYTQYTEHYDLQRAPNIDGAPGAWTTLVTNISPNQDYSDTYNLDPSAAYWYRLIAYNTQYTTYGTPGVSDPLGFLPAVNPLNALVNPVTLHVGQTSSIRWRGIRQSKPFVTLVESLLADILGLKRRILLISPFTNNPVLKLSFPGPGLYKTGNQDTRLDPYNDALRSLQPEVQKLNAIQIQSLRSQLAFKLSTLNK